MPGSEFDHFASGLILRSRFEDRDSSARHIVARRGGFQPDPVPLGDRVAVERQIGLIHGFQRGDQIGFVAAVVAETGRCRVLVGAVADGREESVEAEIQRPAFVDAARGGHWICGRTP